ncbi:S-formylglutathione hydrolase [Dongia mobilis]|uniref:S-formylglutathione hydrolase n=1 Tax=Dongia mobilis TaxID=578943 RepID=A0A4R6WJC3_9PROT|nr:S-formylglutathione hydrolase [Dongia mobilis]TDQ78564.1 S-formylglutathione hydrolase [Dongia mobilis]
MALQELSRHRCFGGWQVFLQHDSAEIGLPMKLGIYLPPAAEKGKVPALTYLAGLTCTEETFLIKAGAQRLAAELGLILIAPDTSPRGTDFPGQAENWDFGIGAGFYVDATEAPWQAHWRMYSYVTKELPALVAENFPVDTGQRGIFGHSMGGHGALICALKSPGLFRSVSAFAPISNPVNCPWGQKAFTGYLGADKASWAAYDASELMKAQAHPNPILVDQGEADQFLERELHPHALEAAAQISGQQLTLRRHAGYDHGYYFIQSFIEDHLRHHAALLK